jgi:excisionase family DNA binding protein
VRELRVSVPDELVEEIVERVRAELQPAPEPPPWLSVKEGADYLGVSEGLIKQAIRRGTLGSYKVDGRRFFGGMTSMPCPVPLGQTRHARPRANAEPQHRKE